jgi:hypothetical protein
MVGRLKTDTRCMDDLAAQFTAIRQADLQTRVDYAVARKMLDSQQASGDAAVKLIEAAAATKAQMLSGPGRSGIAGLGDCVDCQG